MYFPRDEYEERWRRVRAEMDAQGFEWALIWGRSGGTFERYSDVLYLSNYYSSQSGHEYDSDAWLGVSFSAMLLGPDDEPRMVVDEPDFPPDQTPLPAARMKWEKDVIRGTAKMIRESGIERLAHVGTEFLPMKYWQALQAELPNVEFVEADTLVRELRKEKSPRELDCYREIGEKVTAALDEMVKLAVRGGVTQAEVAAAGAAEMMRRGGIPHMVPVSSGPTLFRHCGDPMLGFSPDVRLEQGDMVRMWLYGPVFRHGVGLFWEDPWMQIGGVDPEAVYHEGQTFSTEVFLHWEDTGSAGVEENFIVHADGNERLTTTDLTTW